MTVNVYLPEISAFNSRPHAEVDNISVGIIKPLFPFNSRPHAEVDNIRTGQKPNRNPFNSRPHAEVDLSGIWAQRQLYLSTHDLTQRSTLFINECDFAYHLSTHDLTQRSTVSVLDHIPRSVFQLTTSRRGRQICSIAGDISSKLSTHDLTQRSTKKSRKQFTPGVFQLTTSRRGRQYRHSGCERG